MVLSPRDHAVMAAHVWQLARRRHDDRLRLAAVAQFRAVVLAYAEDKIELPAPEGRIDQFREAPGFRLAVTRNGKSYTVSTLAAFLGGTGPS